MDVKEAQKSLAAPGVLAFELQPDDRIPNNRLPLLVYRQAFNLLGSADGAEVIETRFETNHWSGTWRNGIYSYHHYHSTAHEVLGVFRGSATVQFGGDRGRTQQLQAGDVVIIPAGVGHKNLHSTDDFGVVGAYPDRQEPDLCYAEPGECPKADEKIGRVPLPGCDPVFGGEGPLLKYWRPL